MVKNIEIEYKNLEYRNFEAQYMPWPRLPVDFLFVKIMCISHTNFKYTIIVVLRYTC